MDEKWKPVVGFEHYEVSDAGSIRRADNHEPVKPRLRNKPPRVAAQITFATDARLQTRQLGRVVLEAFVGPPPKGLPHARHRDGDPFNNALPNLFWGPRRAVNFGKERTNAHH